VYHSNASNKSVVLIPDVKVIAANAFLPQYLDLEYHNIAQWEIKGDSIILAFPAHVSIRGVINADRNTRQDTSLLNLKKSQT
jgi:hypothetical protein